MNLEARRAWRTPLLAATIQGLCSNERLLIDRPNSVSPEDWLATKATRIVDKIFAIEYHAEVRLKEKL